MTTSSRGIFVGLGLILFLAGAGAALFILLARQTFMSSFVAQTPLLEATYSGGYVTSECEVECLATFKVYENGEMTIVNRGGETFTAELDDAEMGKIRGIIQTTTLSDVFIQDDDSGCPSAVDGIDTEIGVRTSDGKQSLFSVCDYKFDYDQELLKTVKELNERAGEVLEAQK